MAEAELVYDWSAGLEDTDDSSLYFSPSTTMSSLHLLLMDGDLGECVNIVPAKLKFDL